MGGLEFRVPSRALALWFLGHIAEPQHRLVLVEVIYGSAAETNEFLKIAGKTQSLGFRRYRRVRLHARPFSGSLVFRHPYPCAGRTTTMDCPKLSLGSFPEIPFMN